MLSLSYPSPAPVKAVLNYMGLKAGSTAYSLVPAPAEEAKHYQGCSGLPRDQRNHYGSSSSGIIDVLGFLTNPLFIKIMKYIDDQGE